jgi:CheY-like chemotaxis protein
MNLVTNASDAVAEDEGAIILATRRQWISEADVAALFPGQPVEPGEHVVLEVTDTGCGMPPEVRERIFDPFFTTKAKGRGLGLSAMMGILRGHRAGLLLHSQPGKGSTFQVFFPVAAEAAGIAAAAPPELPPLAQGGKVLLVDDEPEVRQATAAMLQHLGFEIVPAKDGVECLELFRAQPGAFRLVFLDLTMPRMGGREACERLLELQPGLPIVLASGYTDCEAFQGEGIGLSRTILRKPYLLRELETALREALA